MLEVPRCADVVPDLQSCGSLSVPSALFFKCILRLVIWTWVQTPSIPIVVLQADSHYCKSCPYLSPQVKSWTSEKINALGKGIESIDLNVLYQFGADALSNAKCRVYLTVPLLVWNWAKLG